MACDELVESIHDLNNKCGSSEAFSRGCRPTVRPLRFDDNL